MRRAIGAALASVAICSSSLAHESLATTGRTISQLIILASSSQPAPAAGEAEKKESPEETMRRRFPQPVRVGFLIGLPVLDGSDSTIGFIRDVVRTPEGKIQLIVPYASRFGWVSYGGPFAWGRRPVAVPIETVAILARQVAALDMPREDFDTSKTFDPAQAAPIPRDETIQIAITRR